MTTSETGAISSSRRRGRAARLLLAVGSISVFAAGCSTYVPYDSEGDLRTQLADRLGTEHTVEVPFEIDQLVTEDVGFRINPAWSEKRRTEAILDYIFGHLGLEYRLTPTRSAVETFHERQANCISFVNLFVGVGRDQRMNPFYVEVQDYQRWSYQDGVVVSRGHIVGGMYVDGQLQTFDFLPYRPKGYRDFNPIDDITATAHYYNNLGAEALMDRDLATAKENLEIAVELAPDFPKATNNLGVLLLREGESERARSLFEEALQLHPEDVPLMGNLARTYQELGLEEQAQAMLDQLEQVGGSNPFLFVYRGDVALARQDFVSALDYMRRAYQVDDKIPEVHLGLVRVYLATGKIKEARHHVERALKLDATHEEARRYAVMLQQEGRSSVTGGQR